MIGPLVSDWLALLAERLTAAILRERERIQVVKRWAVVARCSRDLQSFLRSRTA
jgi:hypothetical protein